MKAGLMLIAVAGLLANEPALALDASGEVQATGTIAYAFSPDGNAAALAIAAIDSARAQVRVQAFSFTHAGIAQALARAHRRGVDVVVLADPEQVELIGHNVVGTIAAAGVPVFVDPAHAAAHDKVIVVDADATDPAVVTGSFNFTFAAQHRNAENLLVLRGNRALAQAYLENWNRHRAHSAPLRPEHR